MLGDLSPLAGFAQRFQTDPIPEPSLDVMRLCALDWAMCGLATSRDPILASMVQHAALAGAGASSVFYTPDVIAHGGADRLPARAAALINGTISHTLDLDDTHFGHIGHVSTVVIPAALAVAEDIGADFDRFIHAARIGAEVACRVGLWFGRTHYQAGWHQTATSGAYGAAVGAAILMDANVTASLLNVAGLATGQKAQFGSAMKPLNAGMAAAHGVEAAQLAKAGLTGSPDVLDAVMSTMAGEGNTSAFDDLGEAWMFDTVSHKYHACCHGTHAMIEAIKSLGPLDYQDVARIDVVTHSRWMTVCNKPMPKSWLEGKFSYAFLAALTLCGETTLGEGPELYFPLDGRAPARGIMDRVTVRADDSLAETACEIVVTRGDGTVQKASHDLAAPEPLAKRREKVRAKGEDILFHGLTQELEAAIDARDLVAFTSVIRRT